jgi:hypothetical protein
VGSSVLLLIGLLFLVLDLHSLNTDKVDWLYAQDIPVRLFREHADNANISAAEKADITGIQAYGSGQHKD